MENIPEANRNSGPVLSGFMGNADLSERSGARSSLKSIHLSDQGLVIREEAPDEILHLCGESLIDVKGQYRNGIEYYDLRNVHFMNNTDIAHLIDLLKSLLSKGVEVRFLNMGEKVKEKIRLMGLDHIIICS